jgi:hypothetical protein
MVFDQKANQNSSWWARGGSGSGSGSGRRLAGWQVSSRNKTIKKLGCKVLLAMPPRLDATDSCICIKKAGASRWPEKEKTKGGCRGCQLAASNFVFAEKHDRHTPRPAQHHLHSTLAVL